MYHNFLAVVTLLFACATVSFAQDAKNRSRSFKRYLRPTLVICASLIARSTGYFAQEGLDFKLLVISVCGVSVPALAIPPGPTCSLPVHPCPPRYKARR